ncbi:ABC transporter ATP-binding protein [Anaeromicrobium sediminis]|uniref:ABC-type quaternary amine transporter n=1 Tax=Anaeromicrobium sediminis TaxID=1478221 RepID=A0A267MJ68_9FIRM|nr:ABC transporter ATP-binding protein [Anaeromicrobium sediminis]PAB59644.1 ABC transporter [Anaeromicrobium sediminis]
MSIKIEGLKFKYKNSVKDVIKDFSMEISNGEIISIFGESGSGKSTALRIICGLEVPSAGSIKIDDKIIVDNNNFTLPENRQMGMVFQDYALFPHMTIEKNIKFGLKHMNSKEKDNRLKEVLELVDLKGFEKRYPHELSGGQQQRIALARALAPKPDLLLLDEPFSNLDSDLQERIRKELESIIRKANITSIFVTHDKEDSKAIADRVVILKEGEIVNIGKPKDIF